MLDGKNHTDPSGWYNNADPRLTHEYKNEELKKMNADFIKRGFTQGKATFSIQFSPEVIETNSNKIIESYVRMVQE